MRTSALAALCLAALGAWPARAQDTLRPPFVGTVELGARSFMDELNARQYGKLEEYKAVPKGMVLTNLFARYDMAAGARSFALTGSNIGQLDQALSARATQSGLWDAQFRWDRLLHTYSTTARMLETRTSPNVFTLPATRPALTSYDDLGSAPYLRPVRTVWDPMKLALTVTPTEAWDMKAEYSRIAKNGDRPLGMVFGSSPGNQSREILEPIDQTTQDLKLTQSFAREAYQFLLSYDLSVFSNTFNSVTTDNPFQATDSPTAGSARARTALAPNNSAQTITGSGGWNLPYRTRVTGTYSYSAWRQDEQMIPMTINTALANDPRVTAVASQLPTHLDGRAGTKTLNLQATSNPFTQLTVTARLRRFEFRDEAGVESVPVLIIGDRTISTTPVESHRDPFRRENREFTTRWTGPLPVALGFEYGWEQLQLDPEERNVSKTVESNPRITADFTRWSFMQVRARYAKAWRRSEAFTRPDGVYAGTYQNEAGTQQAFRRFDVADRDRERLTTVVTFLPLDAVSLSGTWQLGTDNYPGTSYGVQRDHNSMVGVDVDYTPTARYSVGTGYSYEKTRNNIRARYATPTVMNNTTFDWIGTNTDDALGYYLNASAVLVPNRLDAGLMVERSKTRFLMDAYNPVAPTRVLGGAASDSTNAVAVNLPEVRQNLQPWNLFLRYRVSSVWAATLRYQIERYDQNDWRTRSGAASLNPYNPANVSHIFLGNDYQPFNAQFLTITMTYSPGSFSPWRPGRSAL